MNDDKAAKKKSSSTLKRVVGDDVRAALAPHGFPTAAGPGLCFKPADDELFARGFPDMRFVVKEPPEPGGPVKSVETALDATEPSLRLRVPREIARRFLIGYRVGPTLTVGEGAPRENERLRKMRADVVRSDEAVDGALLEDTLERQLRGVGDPHGRWRAREVLYLFEGFLGAEAVGRAVVRHLAKLATEAPGQGTRSTQAGMYLALALPPLLRRMPEDVASELRTTLATFSVGSPAFSVGGSADEPARTLASLMRRVGDRSATTDAPDEVRLQLAVLEDDARTTAELVERVPHGLLANVARVCWLLGTERLGGKLDVTGHDLVRMVDEVAPIKDPGVVRLIARIATQRAGRSAAASWLRQNAAYARPILDSLVQIEDPKEKSAAETALDLIVAESMPKPSRPLDQKEAEAEIAAIFEDLGARLKRQTQRDAQLDAIRDAHERYAEVRSASGDPTPEASFTHRFGDFGLDRWAALADDALA